MSFSNSTIANQLVVKSGYNGVGAFEMAHDIAVSVSEHDGFNTMRFDDGSEISVMVSDDHEITITER